MALWDRRPGESDQQFEAFRFYLSLPPSDRSMRRAYEDYYNTHGGKIGTRKLAKAKAVPPSRWGVWSAQNSWVERSASYDAHLFSIEQAARERIMVTHAADHSKTMLNLSKQVIAKVEEMLKLPLVRQRIDKDGQTIIIEPVRFTMGDVGFLLANVDRISRLALGMDTDRKHIRLDINAFTDEQLERLASGESLDKVIEVA